MQLVDDYLAAMEAGDADRVLALFAPQAVVHSPLYGDQSAAEFFPMLFRDTAESRLALRRVLTSDDGTVAFWFDFAWVLADGTPAPFTVVDVAELDEQGRIHELHIVYDTAPLRADFDRVTTRSS